MAFKKHAKITILFPDSKYNSNKKPADYVLIFINLSLDKNLIIIFFMLSLIMKKIILNINDPLQEGRFS